MFRHRFPAFCLALLLPISLPVFARPGVKTSPIKLDTFKSHLRFLSDDLLEGRGPGTRGAEIAAKYIAAQYESCGLEPAANGSYFQNVPIVNIKADPSASLTVAAGDKRETFVYGEEFTAQNGLGEENLTIDGADIVFAGYGITAPEFQWDDYKGTDVTGKILLMLVNDPPSEDPKFFGGPALTYYGRWTYKYEEAARHGARGVLLVHTTESATYPWQVVQSSYTGVRSDLMRDANSPPVVALKSWVTYDAAFRIAKLGGQDLPTLEKQARERTFKPVALNGRLSLSLRSQVSRIDSPNVAGLLRGSDPKLKNEYVVVTAHYDHLGVREKNPGDKVYNGAVDNASGVAGVLAIAEALSRVTVRPKRSILFLCVTGEEQGLLGAQYYTERPLFPLLATAANVNLDSLNFYGPTRDYVAMGAERSSLEAVIAPVAKREGIVFTPDPFPEKGLFFRSDHFCFAKAGVPCITLDRGIEVVGKPDGYGRQKNEAYNQVDYHQPTDEIKSDWSFEGSLQHIGVAFQILLATANTPVMPEWKAGDQFKAARDAMRARK